MATKKIEIAGVGPVILAKLRRNRSIRLSVGASGVRVSMPAWTSYSTGAAFVRQHQAWILAELGKQSRELFEAGQAVGKMHSLRFEYVLDGRQATSRVTTGEAIVRLYPAETWQDAEVQERAKKVIDRALKREAELLLAPRLRALATKHNLNYRSVHIKPLKRRWGSCSSHTDITLNMHLMTLPWEQIDYVLLHELTHTVHMNHSNEFWAFMTRLEPRAKQLAKLVRKHQPGSPG